MLVSTQWLSDNLGASHIRVADASWYLPDQKRDPRAEYDTQHIPGAVFFDIDDLSDKTNPLPHMMAAPAKFASRMRALGIGDTHHVVVYDGLGLFSAPRAWWMLRHMGHENVSVLDGGLPKWIRENRRVTNEKTQITPEQHFTPRRNSNLIRNFEQVSHSVRDSDAKILDARSPSRYSGQEKEPRPGLKSGHIPGSLNIHYRDLLAPDGTLKTPSALTNLFNESGVDVDTPVITTCGSGITAAILMLALYRSGSTNVSLYDGSWAEWGLREGAPIATR